MTGQEEVRVEGLNGLSPMSFQRFLAEARSRVPDLDAPVIAARREKPAVGRKGHRRNDGTAAKSLKKLVLSLLDLLVQRRLPVPATGPRSGTVDVFTGPDVSHPWPSSVCWQEPDLRSQILTLVSWLPDARSRPSAEKATDVMRWLQSRFFI